MPKSGKNKSARIWEAEYHPKAEKEIQQLDQAIRERIRRAIEQLQENPLLGKPLVGHLHGHRSRRVGDYRIVYQIIQDRAEGKKLFVLHVGSRGGAYPRAGRRRG